MEAIAREDDQLLELTTELELKLASREISEDRLQEFIELAGWQREFDDQIEFPNGRDAATFIAEVSLREKDAPE